MPTNACDTHTRPLSLAPCTTLTPNTRSTLDPWPAIATHRLDLLPAEVRYNAIFSQAAEANWDALRACYPTEESALRAAETCLAVILPYGADSPASGFLELGLAVNRAENIAGCAEVLRAKFEGEEEDTVLDIITRNPGVLGCVPEQLERANPGDIRRAASIAGGFSDAFGPARRFLQGTSWWDEGKGKQAAPPEPAAKPGWDPLGFGSKGDAENEELLLPQIELEGKMYMYDLKGEYNGIEHVLLTLEGEPVGVWNPETQEPEEVEFVDEGEEE